MDWQPTKTNFDFILNTLPPITDVPLVSFMSDLEETYNEYNKNILFLVNTCHHSLFYIACKLPDISASTAEMCKRKQYSQTATAATDDHQKRKSNPKSHKRYPHWTVAHVPTIAKGKIILKILNNTPIRKKVYINITIKAKVSLETRQWHL